MNVAESICNLALSRLGSKNTISSITNPTTPEERSCALWYDPCRQLTLKTLMPNFALGRKVVAKLATGPAFGYEYAYQYPTDCLKVLGIGDIQEKENNYAIEENKIYTDEDYTDGMNLRYIKDVTDVAKFSIDFIIALTAEIAEKIALAITQDAEKLKAMNAFITIDRNLASALNGQENKPIRINNSKFKMAKTNFDPTLHNKK